MRILIADDNALVRSGIAEIVQDNAWEVCGAVSSGTEVLQSAHVLQPDVVLLDVSMPGTNGLEIARVLRRELPALKIVVVSQHDLDQLLSGPEKAWADAFVDKGRIATDLSPAVRKLFSKT